MAREPRLRKNVAPLDLPSWLTGLGPPQDLRNPSANSFQPRVFVPEGSDAETAPPYSFNDVVIFGFKLRAKRKNLEELCDRLLNFESDARSRYLVASDKVIVELVCTTDGSFKMHALLFRVLVGKVSNSSAEITEPKVFCPYAYVDNPWWLISGREVIGYPNVFAYFDPPVGLAHASTITVDADVYPQDSQFQERKNLVTIHLTADAQLNDDRTSEQASAKSAGRTWLWHPEDFSNPAFEGAFARNWADRCMSGFHTIQLKQFRDAVNIENACYRELVEGNYHATDVNVAFPAGTATLQITDYRSLALSKTLGLDTENAISSGNWYRAMCNVDINVLRTSQRSVLRPGIPSKPVKFIEHLGDPQAPPPYRFEQVKIRGFKLTADRQKLTTLCDRLLNFDERQGFRYCPASDEVILEILSYGSMQSLGSSGWFTSSDRTRQDEMVFRVLVGKVEEGSSEATEPKVFAPFIFVSNTDSVVTGREVVGYPKLLGSFKLQEPDEGTTRLTVTTGGYSRSEASEWSEIVSVEYASPGRFEDLGLLSLDGLAPSLPRGTLTWGQGDFGRDSQFSRSFAKDWIANRPQGFSIIQLKQMRDAVNPSLACHQELIEGQYSVDDFKIAFPAGMAQIRLRSHGSVNIYKALGIDTDVSVFTGDWYLASCNFEIPCRSACAPRPRRRSSRRGPGRGRSACRSPRRPGSGRSSG